MKGWTPLHEACNYGNLSIVQELVWSGAEVNSPGYEAITPLHDAVINDHAKVCSVIIIIITYIHLENNPKNISALIGLRSCS